MRNIASCIIVFCIILFFASCSSTPGVSGNDQALLEELEEITSLPDTPTNDEKELAGDRIAEEIKADEESHYSLPIIYNKFVDNWVHYFQTRGKRFFGRWLSRAKKYLPVMKAIIKKHGLPEDLVYIAMIESGFKTSAFSRARAVGPWQFMKYTGKKYGLKVNWWLDERRDPIKATISAAKYLKDLYLIFDSWYLAAAGYNAGEGKIIRAIRRYNSRNFWYLARKRYLRSETKNYIPKLLAAIIIAKNPAKYGFTNIEFRAPYSFKTTTIKNPTSLRLIAKAAGVSLKTVKKYNPEIRRWMTPPREENYQLKLPVDVSAATLAHVTELSRRQKKKFFKIHRIRRGETLSYIALSYGVSIRPIMKMNRIRNVRALRVGKTLVIPVPPGTRPKKVNLYSRNKRIRTHVTARRIATDKNFIYNDRTKIVYKVRKNDSLWAIARRHKITVKEIRLWNGLPRRYRLLPGEELVLYVSPKFVIRTHTAKLTKKSRKSTRPKGGGVKVVHKVRRGETLWRIARIYGVNARDIKNWNNIKNTRSIRPGKKLTIYKD